MGYYLGGAPLVTRERNKLSDVPCVVAGRQRERGLGDAWLRTRRARNWASPYAPTPWPFADLPQKFVQQTGIRPLGASGVRMGERVPVCARCNRAHGSECRLDSNQCFECGPTGHLAREYPSRVQESRGARRSGKTNQRQLVRAHVRSDSWYRWRRGYGDSEC
ncbi:hypothetical protein CIPAW_11G128000 [Carya illinoinensis]|uniref:CCHC-type domain-containing protein n=1 Tax=Carya illinoinensis TaxID=32201 RepID=A0A8T1NWS9_CARIL|nr:hypothetical protein CIPAW_11G128000 [Carya illinoinensis]